MNRTFGQIILEQTFLSNVCFNEYTTCWEWTSIKSDLGYGRFYLKGKLLSSHRVSYELFIGEIPNDKELDHLCRNRSCVNPEHLEPVTHLENIRRGETGIIQSYYSSLITHCPKGHAYEGSNLRKQGNRRQCIKCQKERDKYRKR